MKKYNCFVRQHSKKHLELKSIYPLTDDVPQFTYDIDFYFFFPAQLHVTEKKIGVKGFLGDIQVYTRFSTPDFTLARLVAPECTPSPLNRIRVLLECIDEMKPKTQERLHYELQILTNVFRVEVRDAVRFLIDELVKNTPEELCIRKFEQLFRDIRIFVKQFRDMHPMFLNHHLYAKDRTAFAWADESISIIIEKSMNRLFSYCGMLSKSDELRKEIEEMVVSETDYRRARDYQYIFREEEPYSGERLAYRESMLKKWSQSAMYMNSEESATPRRISHILSGAAAAVAMIFAVIATIFANSFFTPNSAVWIFLIVISYAFKDRIKEILRETFGHFLPRFLAEQLTSLKDPAVDKSVGWSKGTCRFQKASDVPERIYKQRFKNPGFFHSILQEQDIIHYKRVINIDYRKLKVNHTRLSGITEIIRLRIDKWLREMDDPKDVFYRIEKGKKIKIKGNRVYLIHLIVSLKERRIKDFEELYHYRIVMNKTGLLRIEIL